VLPRCFGGSGQPRNRGRRHGRRACATPKSGVSAKNKNRVLINLHGGAFRGCWPGCADFESIPVSALGRVRVKSVDYREGPDNKFPAAFNVMVRFFDRHLGG
jgi:acetyl esterase/lipase